jgi:hypothetical protein
MNILELKRKALGYSFREDGSGGESGGSSDGSAARAGMGFAGMGSGLSGTGASAAGQGIGGGPTGSGGGGGGGSSGFGNVAGSILGKMFGGALAGPIGAIGGGMLGGYLGGSNTFGSSNTTGGSMDSSTGDATSFGGNIFGTGNLGSILNIAGGINALTGGGSSGSTTGDPFAQYRSGLAAQYAGALQPGGTTNIQGMPGYTQYNTGVMQPALQATQRAGAATGQLYSGGEAAALQKQAQQGYYGFMTDYLNRLATGSGASANPLGGAQLANTMQNQQQAGVMQGIGAIGQGVSGLGGMFGNLGGITNYGTMLSNNAAMSATPNYLQAAGQLSTPDMSGFNPLDYLGG